MADGETRRPALRANKAGVRKEGKYGLNVKRASAGLGLFAAEPIPKGAFVIEYVGVMLTEAEYQAKDSGAAYLFEVGPSGTGALDGAPRWNTARYINHSCKPNCEPTVTRRRVFINAVRNIAAGEELSYNYGPDYFDEYIGAKCRCRGCKPEMHGLTPKPRLAAARTSIKKTRAKR